MRLALILAVFLALAGCGGNPPVVPPVPPLPPVVDPGTGAVVEPPIPSYILADYPDVRQAWIGTAVFYVTGNFSLDDVKKYIGTSFSDTQKLRPTAKLEGMFIVVTMPNDCPRSSGAAFFADGVMAPAEIAGMRQWYPQSFVNGRPCVHGYFGSTKIPPVIYAPTGLAEVIDHEMLHAIWWSNWVCEMCKGDPVWTVVEHGGECDPFVVK
jgi:hypothetical protein